MTSHLNMTSQLNNVINVSGLEDGIFPGINMSIIDDGMLGLEDLLTEFKRSLLIVDTPRSLVLIGPAVRTDIHAGVYREPDHIYRGFTKQ